MKYILTDDSIECGRADSTKYHKITISGSREDGDSLLGLMEAFSITETDLESRFYTKQHKPIMDGGNVTFNLRHLLLGWQVFMWTGSKIYGYCCITNNNDTRQTATMNIFTDDHDAINFMNGGAANNAVASETIHIPPGRDVCFEEWGKYTPFVVRRNSYYLIVVDFPAQTSFASNITISQKTVNLTGLQSPHFFRYNNATDIILPMWPLFSHEEYIVICKAPKYVYRVYGPSEIEQQSLALAANNENSSDIELLALMVGAESLHLESCNIPYPWTKIVFLVLLVLGIIFFLFSVVTCVICIHVCRRCRDRLTNPCKSKTHRSRDGGAPYDRLGNVQTE